MEKLMCMAEQAILVHPILRWAVMMLECSLGFNFLRACISCSCFISGVHDGVKSHLQVVQRGDHDDDADDDDDDDDDDKTSSAAAELIRKEELQVVLRRMGLCEGEQLEHVTRDEFSGLFEEEPSLEEVKEAFAVFDENSDGFIDPAELHRVLSRLGLAEGLELEACRRMIRRYDSNLDGKLDFMEFVRVMEISLNVC